MNKLNEVEILLVEDNPNDAELALRALKKNNLANSIEVVTDGEEALNFIFALLQLGTTIPDYPSTCGRCGRVCRGSKVWRGS